LPAVSSKATSPAAALKIRQIPTDNCRLPHHAPSGRHRVDGARGEAHRPAHQDHPGANIPPGELERITASLLVVRCARCHGEETLNLMVLKTQPERLATVRRMAALPGSGVRPDQALAIAQAFDRLIDDSGGR
jgi:hypothetical protein